MAAAPRWWVADMNVLGSPDTPRALLIPQRFALTMLLAQALCSVQVLRRALLKQLLNCANAAGEARAREWHLPRLLGVLPDAAGGSGRRPH